MMKGYIIIALLFISFVSFGKTIPLVGSPSIYYPDVSTLNIQPGDTLLITSVNPDQVYLVGVIGSGAKHVVLTASPGIVIGGHPTRNVQLINCRYVDVVGLTVNGHGNNRLGIQSQFCSDFRYKDIFIDSCNIGIQHKGNPDFGNATSTPPRPPNPNTWWPNYKMYNVSFYNCHVKHINNEGFYVGHTYSAPDGNDPTRPPAPILLLSMENCTADSCGWDGVQVTGAWGIYMNNIHTTRTGLLGQSGQAQGITIQDNTQGVFNRLRVDTANAAGLNINSIWKNLYKNIYIDYASYSPNSNMIFVDNRPNHGITLPFPQATTLYMDSVWVGASDTITNNAINVNNGTVGGAVAANVGQIRRLFYNPTDFKIGVTDKVPNQYVGGTIGTPITSPVFVDSVVYYKGFFRDVFRIPTIQDLTIPPLDPMFLYGVNTSGLVTLHWDTTKSSAGSPLLGYKVYKSLDSSSFSLLGTVPPSTLSFSDNSVTDSAYYFYKVNSYTLTGESVGLNCIKYQFIEPSPPPTPVIPSPPSNLSSTGGNGFVNLSWSAGFDGNSPLTGYNIYRGTVAGSTSYLTTISPSLPSYTDNTVTNETRYYYTVTESNAIGESIKSNETSALPTAFTVPSAPTNPIATPGNTQVTVSWSAPLNNGGTAITNYKVYRTTNASGAGKNLIRTVNGSTFTITDTGRTNGTTYYYYISAVNTTGEGPVSSQVSATPN